MSKIFEALKRTDTGIPDLVLPDAAVSEPPAPPRRTVAAREAEPAPAPKPARPEPPAPAPAPPVSARPAENAPLPGGIRELPLKLPASAPLLPFDNGGSLAGEQYRIMRTKILQHPRQPRMIVVSSPGPGDGKSTTAVNLAGVLALKAEGNVLLLEADFRRPTMHLCLGMPPVPGLAEVLAGAPVEQALIRASQIPLLHILTAGQTRANPTELLGLSRWPWLCAHLRKQFKYIIVDCPPVGAVADYDLVQAVADGVVMIVRPDHTKRHVSMRIMPMVPKDKLIGVVLNCVKPWFLWRAFHPDHYGYYSPAAAART